jgi:hypothetical protein
MEWLEERTMMRDGRSRVARSLLFITRSTVGTTAAFVGGDEDKGAAAAAFVDDDADTWFDMEVLLLAIVMMIY